MYYFIKHIPEIYPLYSSHVYLGSVQGVVGFCFEPIFPWILVYTVVAVGKLDTKTHREVSSCSLQPLLLMLQLSNL